jgi:cell division protein FtsW (lipid II flippase)
VSTLSPRNRELLNLIVVGMLTGLGFTSVYIARSEVVSPESLTYAAFFLLVYLIAHVVTRLTVPYADPYLLPLAGLLAAIGLTEIYRLNPDDAFRQGLWVVIGVALFSVTLIALHHDYRRLESYKYVIGLGALVLLVLPALPVVGREIRGARLWVEIGPFRFQPGEFAKILLIVFLAGYLREKREVLAQGRLKDFGPLLLIWGGAMAVLVQTNDLGSGLLYFGIFLAMLYVATSRIVFVVGGMALFLAGSAFVYQLIPRVQDRVTIWLDPWPYAKDESFQLVQSLFAIAFGGFGGTGLGRGTFTTAGGTNLIPDLNTDFIYAALAHELGLAGISAVLLVYMLFVARGFRIAMLAQDGFSKLLAAGLTFSFALQTFIIVGGVLRLIPLTGITLPFVSYGGSSLLANFVLLALLLLVSNRALAPRN